MQPLAAYQRRVLLILLIIILSGLIIKLVDRQRQAVGFNVRGFLDGYKYSSAVDTSKEAVKLSTNVLKQPADSQKAEMTLAANELKVNINTASAVELENLPGIGVVLAQRIIAYRDSVGRFNESDDLLEVSGIGKVKLAKMKEYLEF